MLGDSAVLGGGGGGGGGERGGSGDSVAASAAAAAATHEAAAAAAGGGGGGIGSNSGSDIERAGRIEEGERSFGGNRWPRQETLALLSIRCDMDVAFRDASVKGPLWEEVSRKLAELGYHRSAKKCKEKFENVYKYHKRTKDGRSGKSEGKTYRFFDQLEALDQIHNPSSHQPPTPSNTPQLSLPAPPPPSLVVTTTAAMSLPISTATTTVPVPMPMPTVTNTTPSVPNVTVPSTTSLPNTPIPQPQGIVITTPPMNLTIPSYPQPTNFQPSTANPPPVSFPHNIPTDLLSNSSSYSTSSDETLEGTRKRKRKWKDFFERLMQEVIEKQEELQKRFLEAIEKREHERMVREEAWRAQEMQRINREREILAQERSIAAARDAAVMSFLQKIAEQQNLGQQALSIVQQQPAPPQQQPQPNAPAAQVHPPPPPPQQQLPVPPVIQPGPPQQPVMVPQQQQQQQQQQQVVTNMEIVKVDNNGENLTPASSSRWPKVEVEALIKLRTSLDNKYQENGPKGPLWEEISAGMRRLGYNRNSKRCKEKWENINKYFKKVKESNKRRPEDSKTCPYFHQLDALYREKSNAGGSNSKAESMVAPLMVRPEQQWPPQQMEDPMEQNRGEEGDDDMDEDDKDGEEDEEEDEGGGSGSGGSNFEIVAASKPGE